MTHVKQPHPHREIMKAYADDMSLCVFVKNANTGEWWEISRNIEFNRYQDYFLCLPKHKDSVLNLLNGGESQARGEFNYWLDASSTHPAFSGEDPVWFVDHWYMLDEFESRIKPKKVKKVIATFKDGGKLKTTRLVYDSIDQLKSNSFAPNGFDDWTFHEIEIEE